ncbi:MAG: hypothetical protein PHP26_03395 [Syntrophomonas sp.]|uniref:hypothetical protein n=1 Tax=Syntrophomonas sp. TaxID=2053627 RepID=UPI00261484D5|nr:hypothetical protein [Syntrophomonas sp.]MDD2510359.1 hypothetical protein [Syntrophomonas sp.]MDD3879019.1 hypothetical protein [Syntrophomonas sp.]MDD4626586.1 hypothetical protein [Syntrophomonas sp.]
MDTERKDSPDPASKKNTGKQGKKDNSDDSVLKSAGREGILTEDKGWKKGI